MEWLNYHHLLYFWTVARQGTIARASEELTPPESLLGYVRRTLGASDAALPAETARLTCFAYQPGAQAASALQRRVRPDPRPDPRRQFAPGSRDRHRAASPCPSRRRATPT